MNGQGFMNLSRLQPPTRSVIMRVLLRGFERHHMKPQKTNEDIKAAVTAAEYDTLIDLAFFAISDIGDNEKHKEQFIERCKGIGIE